MLHVEKSDGGGVRSQKEGAGDSVPGRGGSYAEEGGGEGGGGRTREAVDGGAAVGTGSKDGGGRKEGGEDGVGGEDGGGRTEAADGGAGVGTGSKEGGGRTDGRGAPLNTEASRAPKPKPRAKRPLRPHYIIPSVRRVPRTQMIVPRTRFVQKKSTRSAPSTEHLSSSESFSSRSVSDTESGSGEVSSGITSSSNARSAGKPVGKDAVERDAHMDVESDSSSAAKNDPPLTKIPSFSESDMTQCHMFSFYKEDAEAKGPAVLDCWNRLWSSWSDLLPFIPRAVDLGAVGEKTSSTYGRGAGQRQFTHIDCTVRVLTDADLAIDSDSTPTIRPSICAPPPPLNSGLTSSSTRITLIWK